MPEFVKSPGWDWTITYIDDEDARQEMAVFGVVTIEEALKEARFSLPEECAIIAVSRDD